MNHLDLIIVKEIGRTESIFCEFSGKTFRKESALTALAQKKSVALSVGRINIDSLEDKNSNLA